MVVFSLLTDPSQRMQTRPTIVRQAAWVRQLAGGGLPLLLLLLLTGCDATKSAATPAPVTATERDRAEELALDLHAAIWHRLALMPAVAQTKFVSQRPITDPAREAALVEEFRSQAHARGIHPDFAERVILAQVEASKLIQTEMYKRWAIAPPAAGDVPRDLVEDLRPSIDAATDRILIAIQFLGRCPTECGRAIEHAYARRSPLPPQVSEAAWDLAWAPLRDLPPNFAPGREALGRVPSARERAAEHQPLLPEFAPEK